VKNYKKVNKDLIVSVLFFLRIAVTMMHLKR